MLRPLRLLTLLLAIAACALVLSACGSSSSSTSSSASAADTATGGGVATTDAATTTAAPAANGAATPKIQFPAAPKMTIDPSKNYTATLVTNKGSIVVKLLPKTAPVAVNNFVFLAQHKFYANVPFHRIVKGFVIQTGDPTGTGTGGPGYTIADDKVSGTYARGVLAMANTGQPHSGGSQFFVTLTDLSQQLPKTYPIFGTVTSGMNVADAIANTPVKVGQSGEDSDPTQKVTLENVTIAVS